MPTPQLVHNIEELVRATHGSTLEDVGDYFTDCCLDCDVQVEFEDGVVTFLLGEYGRGVGLTFPFTLDEVGACLVDIEDEHHTPINIEGLEESIELLEGFSVSIELAAVDEGSALAEKIGRRVTDSGIEVQTVGFDYPYRARMKGSATVEDWIRTRFSRHCLGLTVEVEGGPGTTLKELRGEDKPVRTSTSGSGPTAR